MRLEIKVSRDNGELITQHLFNGIDDFKWSLRTPDLPIVENGLAYWGFKYTPDVEEIKPPVKSS